MTEHTLYDREEPALSPFERGLYDDVSTDEPWALLERFADLERVSGTEDERAAADYVTERLDALDVSHELFTPELYISQPHDATVSIESPTQTDFPSAKTVAFSNDETIRGEAVHVETEDSDELAGAFDVGLDVDHLKGDVAGKVIVVESILPIEAIGELAKAGAAAFVGIHPHDEEPHEGIATPVWGGVPDPWSDEEIPDIVVANLSRREGDQLLDQLDEHGTVEVEVSASTTTDWMECPLVLAQVEGEAAPDTDDFVLLHGHIDSWYEGITDNATGDAGMLETARVFNDHRDELERDLWVAWWPGHSTGRYAGSTWFVDEYAHQLHEHCVAHVNMDSPGVKGATEFYVRPKWMPDADGLCRGAIDDVAGKDTEENRPPRAGDYSFNNLGITGMSLQSCLPAEVREERGYHPVGGSGGHADAWHLSTDTIEKADPEVLVRDVQVFATAVARLTNADYLPLDHRRSVEHFHTSIDYYESHGGDAIDLNPVREALNALGDDLERLYSAIDEDAIEPETANRAIVELSRRLVRLDFAERGPFQQDPAVYRPPLPLLGKAVAVDSLDDEARFAEVHLRRARNHVVHELRQAAAAVRTAL